MVTSNSNIYHKKNNALLHLMLLALLFVTAVGTICFKALLILQKKFFENLDKAKDLAVCNSLFV